jgi:DNA-directed RNA polymerase omega subunit
MNKQEELDYEATLGLTSGVAVNAVENRYDLVLIGARRARELSRGDMPKMSGPKRSAVVTALKEIENGKVGRDYLYRSQNLDFQRPRRK